jgi:GNAT superfamily N-acetyltransferase
MRRSKLVAGLAMPHPIPPSVMMNAVFSTPRSITRPATQGDAPALAAFCRANPGYDFLLTGQLPNEAEWVEDFLTDLPPVAFGWTATHKLISFLFDDPDILVAVMDVSENMIATGVGHIGLFQVAEAHYGTGLAHELYCGLEGWLASRGMDAFRLGVLQANPRGQAFWARHGYVLSRHRAAPDDSGHVSRVMMKSLLPTSLQAWHARVPRDHPDAP